MKINSSKFALAFGLALSISFFICNIIFYIGGSDFSLSIVNTIFHDMNFKPLLIENNFSIVKVLCGMFILFLEGLFVGYVTAALYNTFNKQSN